MDSQDSPINRTERRPGRLSRARERILLWFEDWVLIRGADALRSLLDLLRRPFEAAAWGVRRGFVWPIQDRAGAGGVAIATALVALVIGGGAYALLGSGGSSTTEPEPPANELAAVAEVPPAPQPAPEPEPVEPEVTLKGATPVFEPAAKGNRGESGGGKAAAETPASPAETDPATATIGTDPEAGEQAKTGGGASSSDAAQTSVALIGKPAGPQALAVAEDFAAAFVLYETGGKQAAVRKAFAGTASPELTRSLMERPPRQPKNVKVPKAKVVNVVAGPSQAGVYTVSVSLLRVGVTSELRLDMEKLKRKWRVTNVLG